ncbi:MAG: hypothetical protein PHI63_06180 [Patescibacteria group bacterium]|nr:hypothetical protein [Patescibacteria group bacterium]
MKKIFASAPTRIDLAGGTLDLDPIYLFHPNASTVNLAITVPATVTLTPRPGQRVTIEAKDLHIVEAAPRWQRLSDRRLPLVIAAIRYFAPASGFDLVTKCSAPAGSGLAGSSALNVAMLAAFRTWQKQPLNREEMRVIARGIETSVIKVPTGLQDFLPLLYGGLNVWHFGIDGIRREPLRLSADFLKTLERQLVLAYTGIPHFSGMNNWEIFKRHVDGNRKVVSLFDQLRDNAIAMAQALKSESLPQVARVLQKDWIARRKLAPGVSTPKINRLLAEGKRVGVLGSRVCGAGGGGCVAMLARVGKAEAVRRWISQRRILELPYRIDWKGVVVKSS